jgi:hypothetical protein
MNTPNDPNPCELLPRKAALAQTPGVGVRTSERWIEDEAQRQRRGGVR